MTGVYGDMRFQVPSEVADELDARGLVRSSTRTTVKSVDIGELVLVVYNTTASTVTLFQAPDVIRALATSLVNWFRRNRSERQKFELTARGPHGLIEFSSDEPPDIGALTQFLYETIWRDRQPSNSDEE